MARRWQDWVDSDRLRDRFEDVQRVVAMFEISTTAPLPDDAKLRVKVIQSADGRFVGKANFMRQTFEMADPYVSQHPMDTMDQAFWDAIDGLYQWGDDALWILNPFFD